jgi:hypothetical protein
MRIPDLLAVSSGSTGSINGTQQPKQGEVSTPILITQSPIPQDFFLTQTVQPFYPFLQAFTQEEQLNPLDFLVTADDVETCEDFTSTEYEVDETPEKLDRRRVEGIIDSDDSDEDLDKDRRNEEEPEGEEIAFQDIDAIELLPELETF